MANYEVLEPGGHAALIDGLKDYTDREGGVGAEQIADGSVNLDKLGDDVLDELDSKAYADGYYAQLTAGAADNLTGRGDTTTASFLYRTAGGTADIETGQAVAKSVKGNTLVWNQRLDQVQDIVAGNQGSKTFDSTTKIWTITCTNESGTSFGFYTNSTITYAAVANHKTLIRAKVKLPSSVDVRLGVTDAQTTFSVPANTFTQLAVIVSPTESRGFNAYTNGAADLTMQVKDVEAFDLTQMFGAGNEPSTVAEFEALFPLPYYEYDAGSLLSVNMEGIETVGFNQWDEQWENGNIDNDTGASTSSMTLIRSKNFIPVFPGMEYYFRIDTVAHPGAVAYVFYYDANKNHISDSSLSNTTFDYKVNGITTPPANARYMRFRLNGSYTGTYQGDICINLSWSGRRNGEYEPFWSSQREIAASTYFPDGMRSAGSVRDELTSTEAITRVGVVDLTTITWTYDAEHSRFSSAVLDYLPTTSSSQSPNTLIKGLTLLEAGGTATSTDGYTIASNRIWIKVSVAHPEITTSAALVTWLEANVSEMLYALATPTVTPIDPALNLSYRVDDFGTERVMVPSGSMSAPVPMSIVYGLNAVDFIRRAPTEYVSHDSHENFVDALEAEMGVTVTETFDDIDNAYEYSIVPTDGMTIKQAKENLRGLLDLVQGTIGSVTDWSEIAEMASHGSSFLVGTQFQTTYKSAADGTEYEMPWDVMHFETATVKGGSSVAGVYLESHYALPFATMFDQVEAFYAVPSGGLAAGTYSITFGNTSAWGQVPANSTYSFTLANSYSQGAQLCFNRSIYSYAPDTCSVQAFATQGATTASETVTVSAGSAGTSLGTIGTEQVTDSSDLNHLHHIGLGSNRWMTSALRQWLNTDADGGTWWVPQTKWDRPPSYASYDGFLKGLDHDLVSAMREVRVVTAQSYSADGGTAAAPVTDVTYDKVFLPSWEQQYLVVSQSYGGTAGLEGSAWDYWKLAAGTANPRPASTSGNESTYTTAYVRYGMENHATARPSWLRSAYRSNGSNAANVSSSGHCGHYHAVNGFFAAPACFIG